MMGRDNSQLVYRQRKQPFQRRNRRRGYALLLVLAFITLMFSSLAVSQRYLSSAIRATHFQAQVEQRNAGSLSVAADALMLLETGLPPEAPFVCQVARDTPSGECRYTVTFRSEELEGGWTIRVNRSMDGEWYQEMPTAFSP
jgi:hypothetical protein